MNETDLTLSCGGLPPWSARGCTQVLAPIPNGELRRTVNGDLAYVGNQDHHKYCSVIKCKDKSPIALDGLWQGSEMIVGCIQRVVQQFQTGQCVLDRDPVNHSVVAFDAKGQAVEIHTIERRNITLATDKGYVSYCPLLKMRVVDFAYDTDEWGLTVGWELKLEEI